MEIQNTVMEGNQIKRSCVFLLLCVCELDECWQMIFEQFLFAYEMRDFRLETRINFVLLCVPEHVPLCPSGEAGTG